jgi:sigma-B regulation protein RsbU (phosphoserine phosphatase)
MEGRDRELPDKKMFAKPVRPLQHVPVHGVSAQLLKIRAQKRLAVRERMGLLRHKTDAEPLSDVEQKMLDHELAIAEELQGNLLPRRIPQIQSYELSAYYKPSKEVGGDYYDFIEIDADHYGILVADVSGKGIPGCIVMAETRVLIRNEAQRTLSPAELMTKVNSFLNKDIKRGMFVTAFYLILNSKKNNLTLTSAGHNPMVLWRKSTNTCNLVNTGGLALGIDKGPLFERCIREQKLQLYEGDRFVLYTDGVIESMNENNEQFGQPDFYRSIKELAEKDSTEFINLIVDRVEKHQGNAPQHDDITLVTGRFVG